MLGVDNQYVLRFSIPLGTVEKPDNRFTDFMVESDLELFHIHEEAGNVLPTFAAIFYVAKDNKDLLKYLNEGNSLEVSFGRTTESMIDCSLLITKYDHQRSGQNNYRIQLAGMYSARDYTAPKIEIHPNQSGVEVINSLTDKYFKVESNITKSADKQNWVRHNISGRKFVNDVWLHSWLPKSFLTCGISSDGKFILKDIVKEVVNKREQGWDWRFTPKVVEDNDIAYDGDYFLNTESGFINHWVGYGLRTQEFNQESGIDRSIFEEIKPLLTQSKALLRSEEIQERIGESRVLNDNVHGNYWRAYLKNMQYLAVFGSVKIILSFHKEFYPVKVLDLVMFIDYEIGEQSATGSTSGLYFVKEVSRVIAERQLTTTVVLCREGLGESQGGLR